MKKGRPCRQGAAPKQIKGEKLRENTENCVEIVKLRIKISENNWELKIQI